MRRCVYKEPDEKNEHHQYEERANELYSCCGFAAHPGSHPTLRSGYPVINSLAPLYASIQQCVARLTGDQLKAGCVHSIQTDVNRDNTYERFDLRPDGGLQFANCC